jgi:hypothetical protein
MDQMMVRKKKYPNLAKNCSWSDERTPAEMIEVSMPQKTEMPCERKLRE